jgi:hypothetical protein
MALLSFSEFTSMKLYESVETLQEQLVVFNGGKKFGQIVFMSGGAGSGKGMAIKKFMDSTSYKIRDVDEVKQGFMKLHKIKGLYPELKGLNLSNPEDTSTLHAFVKKTGVVEKSLDLLLQDLNTDKGLPNILFDITGKSVADFEEVIPSLTEAGYTAKSMHILWVLTDYSVAVQRNRERGAKPGGRSVSDEIMLKTHSGAAKMMEKIIATGHMPKGMDGKFAVIINDDLKPENYAREGNAEKTMKVIIKKDEVTGKILKLNVDKTNVKSFKYFTIKKEGQTSNLQNELKDELYGILKSYVPRVDDLSHLF